LASGYFSVEKRAMEAEQHERDEFTVKDICELIITSQR
jgi:hypothetical protein